MRGSGRSRLGMWKRTARGRRWAIRLRCRRCGRRSGRPAGRGGARWGRGKRTWGTWTRRRGGRGFASRRAVVRGVAGGAAGARRAAPPGVGGAGTPRVVFLFAGQGAQYVGRGRAWYARERVFREGQEAGAAAARAASGVDVREV